MVGWGGGSIPLAYRGHVTNAPADSRVERRTGRLPASSTFPLAPAQLVRPCREADSLPPGDRALLVVDRRHSDCPHLIRPVWDFECGAPMWLSTPLVESPREADPLHDRAVDGE